MLYGGTRMAIVGVKGLDAGAQQSLTIGWHPELLLMLLVY